jgi:hypothetical protein
MEIMPRRQTINITPRSSPWEMNDDVFLVDLTRPVVAATKVTRAPAKLGRLIPLSQGRRYLLARRIGRHDFGSRFTASPDPSWRILMGFGD